MSDVQLIERAIFVLTGRQAAQRFLGILPDLLDLGLTELTLLHPLPSRPGPVEPMTDLANWVRHFEAAVPEVDLALKRGNPVRWISELARYRKSELVVLPPDMDRIWIENLERVRSPLRALGVPVLVLPREAPRHSLLEHVCVCIRDLDALEAVVANLQEFLGAVPVKAIHVPTTEEEAAAEGLEIAVNVVADGDGIGRTLLEEAEREEASLLVLLTGGGEIVEGSIKGAPVVRPVITGANRPVLVFPSSTH